MTGRVLLDTGPLVALLNRRDAFHGWSKASFADIEPPLLTCEAVITEACHLLRRQPNGKTIVLEIVDRGVVHVDFHLQDEVADLKRLRRRYADVPMDLADACLVRMSEIHSGCTVLTLDSNFKVYRKHGRRVIPTISPQA